ncbi:putative RNA-binding Zn ribbon-like protein [Kribbella orskensis]|uniref:RNA-binding Zn ribbon-like protein n=1 Tax=Kribbella orskensis TaxID=2512216 RepID=A0ABY2BMM3_9ACTN|nr:MULTISPECIES: CGNR zinc finger domain-containing protein [Kribbella]TCN41072.1 putative RNA-binding Zn ribbon-like protein [Kribbella sp. VKM Ac-2500]TCO24324.1 putative RNA-binding Zn ribbon-like protein [Kribbella orskensis]
MDATEHLEASLAAAIALANSFGAEWSQGRRQLAGDGGVVEAALRLTTNRVVVVDDSALTEFAEGGKRLYRALNLLADGSVDESAQELNELLQATRAAPQLLRQMGSPWHLHFSAPGVSEATGWLAEFTTAAAMLLGSSDQQLLRACTAERCDNLFLDATRNHTQRFCSTACQNRTKVAAFRARGA